MNIDTMAAKLEHRALREGWCLPDDKRTEVMEKTFARATCGIPSVEEDATRTLIAAESLSLKRQQLEQKKLEAEHARKIKLIEAAIRLGIVSDGRAAIGGTVISASEC